jgi:hypothetical protein
MYELNFNLESRNRNIFIYVKKIILCEISCSHGIKCEDEFSGMYCREVTLMMEEYTPLKHQSTLRLHSATSQNCHIQNHSVYKYAKLLIHEADNYQKTKGLKFM